ncbi:hypothetical protein PT974_03670 [Cladobotryum mycophilum]|uniref:Uncharacterized protein n=1 Tax=Cladobotryum mycophilum TaxID=491253 RepID=A0ABR0SU65_9HYPO
MKLPIEAGRSIKKEGMENQENNAMFEARILEPLNTMDKATTGASAGL